MTTKIKKITQILALSGLFALFGFIAMAAQDLPLTAAADKVASLKILPAGFYQFNNLEIFKSPTVDEPPATIEVIQKNAKPCVVYENGKTNSPLPCVFNGNENSNYIVQIEERTTLLGSNQEPALLSDFTAGDHINVLGWLSADSKTIRAAVVRSLASKDFHQSLSGTIKKVDANGFTIILANGDEVLVKTPIVEGAQVTIKGVFDKVNNIVSNVLSIFIKPIITLEAPSVEKPEAAPAPDKKPSTLFKNFLKVFGL
ncbi:MAG: hypothetical protein Q7K16_01125 [Candidatus Azambacteria bacterium]|nr:hypothetical protein [Candidatus Azambacteria bacterium]